MNSFHFRDCDALNSSKCAYLSSSLKRFDRWYCKSSETRHRLSLKRPLHQGPTIGTKNRQPQNIISGLSLAA